MLIAVCQTVGSDRNNFIIYYTVAIMEISIFFLQLHRFIYMFVPGEKIQTLFIVI